MWSARILSVVLLLLICSSCAPVYVPNARQTNMMSKKGELHASAQAGTNGGDLQVAYAVSDKFGLFGSGSFKSDEASGNSDSEFHEHRYGELGAIYYRPFGKIGRFEALAGVGFGEAEAVDQYEIFGPQQVRATGRYNKLFAQANIGLETEPFETGLALRMGQVTFNEFETSSTGLQESESGTFFEPAVFARLGWPNFKLESQLGMAGLLQDEVAFDYESLFFSVGLHFQLDTQK